MIIRKNHSAMVRFSWGYSDVQRTNHCRIWDAMCSLKCLGRMGFKDLKVFNDAFFTREALRLICEPTSLFCRVMEAKHFSNCDFLNSFLRYSSSYS